MKTLLFLILCLARPIFADQYHHQPQTLNLDSARQSTIEALRSVRGYPSPRGKGDEAAETREGPVDLRSAEQVSASEPARRDRLGEVAASPSLKFEVDGGIPLDGVSSFGWDLFSVTAKNENTIFSPYSIYSCLAMTAAGAKEDTLKEMQKVLRLPANLTKLSDALTANNESLQGHLKIANSLWVAPKFAILADFRKTIETEFHASIQSLDFSASQEAANIINQWIANHTDQKITELFAPTDLENTTKLVLANSLYFSAKFLSPFNPKMTSPQSFWVDTDSIVKTPMMQQTAPFLYVEDETFQTVAIPMQAHQVAFVVFLPKEKTFSGLSSLMTSDKFKALLENLDAAKVRVRLPKFILRERFDLNQTLSQLGISTAFTPQANFSGMDGKTDLFLSKVLHETYFALDESGIVAAAATGAAMNVTSTGGTPKDFIADHPFIFALVDLQTQIPLFLGELMTPP